MKDRKFIKQKIEKTKNEKMEKYKEIEIP